MMNASDPAQLKPKQFKLGAPTRMPRVGCLASRYALISGGYTAKGCSNDVYLLDTMNLPAAGSTLPSIGSLNATGSVAVAASLHGGAVGFFDGASLNIFDIHS